MTTRYSRHGGVLHCAAAVTLAGLLGGPACARVYHVDGINGVPGNNGWTWQTPFQTLDEAISVAVLGDEIWVRDGEYAPKVPASPNPRWATFNLDSNRKLYGGFLGIDHPTLPNGESLPKQRDIEANETILTGDLVGSGQGYQAYHVVSSYDAGVDTCIDGFTITRGYAEEVGAAHGAGMDAAGYRGGIVRCTFVDNKVVDGGGGAFFLDAVREETGTPARIFNCRFFNNTADEGNEGYGGAVQLGQYANARIVNSLFHDNEAMDRGGAIHASDLISNLELINCTIAYNTAVEGGGVYYDETQGTPGNPNSNGTILNCIFWGNEPLPPSEPQFVFVAGNLTTIEHNCIQGWTVANGNINDDPLFVDAAGGDYHVQAGSECIDKGDNSFLPNDDFDLDYDEDQVPSEPIPMDLDGLTRVMGDIGQKIVDMGAYETLNCPSDVNGDDIVNVLDLLAVLAAWGATSGPADINEDNIVNVLDLLQVLADWGCGDPIEPGQAPEDVQDCIDTFGDDIEKMTGCIEAIIKTGG